MRTLTILSLAGCLGVQGAGSATAEPPPALVRVASAEPGELADTLDLPAEVRAFDRARLAAGASGPVVQVDVREGHRAQKGELLLRIDPAPAAARAALADAESRETEIALGRARRELARLRAVKDGVLSASELDVAETDALALEARLARQQAAAREARVALGRHQLTAPFDGVVQQLLVSEGDWVEPGTTVIELVSSDRVDLRVDAPRELVQHVAFGDPVALSHRGRAAAARVVGVVPSLDPASRTAVVRVEPEPPSPDWLVAGLSVAARFDVRHDAVDAARIPRDALVLGAVGTRVIKVVDGVAEAIDVEVLATAGDQALVRPLSPGDVVVVRGNERLRTGQKLVIEQPRAAVEDPR